MSMDKVSSSPVIPTSDGWASEETPLSKNEAHTLNTAHRTGTCVSSFAEIPPERHTVADLRPDSVGIVAVKNPSLEGSKMVGASSNPQLNFQSYEGSPSLSLKLQPLTEGDSESDSEEHSHSSNNKVASFYIGDDQGCTRDLAPPSAPEEPPNLPTQQQLRRVQILDQQTKAKPVEFKPPDGGYGWVVAFSACLVNVWIVGFIKSYGVFYVHVRNAFPEASAYHASWLPALLATIGLIIAPMTGMLCRNFTSRKVSFVGGIFCFLGLLLGSQAVTMNQLILSVGILTGLGAGLTTTPGVLIVSLYFEKRRALASAICVSGNALGGFFMPPLVDYLLALYGLQGTMLIMAAMQLHICAASMFYRPIRQHALIQALEKSKQAKQAKLDLSETQAPVPEYNKLLPNTPATPRAALPSPASAPGTPLARSHAIWQKMVGKRLNSTTTEEEEEIQRQVSFLRSSSMMNSIPDLTLYARSWSISGERASLGSRSSMRMTSGSKSSLSRLSMGTSSKSSLSKLGLVGENKHPLLLRLTADGEQPKTVKHPTLVRLASEEEGVVPLPRNLSGGIVRTQLGRQTSCRRVQGRIMSAVKEQDTDSQISDEVDQIPKVPEEEMEDKLSEDKPSETEPRDAETTEKEKDVDDDDDDEKSDKDSDDGPSCCYAFMISCFDVTLFKNPLFLMVAISVFFMASGAPHAIFFLPAYATSVDIPSSKIPHMLSISSLVDLVGRLGIGFISDLGICRISYLYFVCCVGSGVAVLLVPQMTTFSSLSAIMGVYGFGVGAWFVLIPTILARHHGAARLASSYGLARLFHGSMNFISPQINGLLVDSTNSYVYCYYFMGTCMVIAALPLLLEPFLVGYVSTKEKQKKEIQQENNNQAEIKCCDRFTLQFKLFSITICISSP